jgi:hypothetical protein
MDNINLSLEFLGGLLGKSRAELEGAFKSSDGEGLKPESEIKAYISQAYSTKLDSIKTKASADGEGKGTRLARKEVEDFLKDNFGISEGMLNDRLTALKSKVETGTTLKPEEITPEIIKNSDFYKKSVKSLQDALQAEKEAHQSTRKGFNAKELSRSVSSFADSLLSDEKHKFVLPKGEKDEDTARLRKNWKNVLVNQIMSDPKIKLSVTEGKLVVLDSETNDVLVDEQHNPVTATAYGLQVAKSLFPVAAASDRSTPPRGDATGGNRSNGQKVEGVPNFGTLDEAAKWINNSAGNDKVTPEMLTAAKNQLQTLSAAED